MELSDHRDEKLVLCSRPMSRKFDSENLGRAWMAQLR